MNYLRFLAAATLACFALLGTQVHQAHAQDAWLPGTAHLIPEYTAPDGEGYFAIIEGLDRKLYIGTHANAANSWLVALNPADASMDVVVDVHATLGYPAHGFVAQSKIHTRNNVGASGKIYFGTKQGYPAKGESRLAYPGGYPMAFDPATRKTQLFPIPIPHQGINSITPDESRNLFYVSTCSDTRPLEHSHFMVFDTTTSKYTDLLDTEHVYGFIVIDAKGRAYHPIRGGTIARYNPDSKQLDRLQQTIDGRPPTAESRLADEFSHPINWDISHDRNTIYAVPMSGNAMYAYDVTSDGDTLVGKTLGPLVADGRGVDCRALAVGPTGTVWAAVTVQEQVTLDTGRSINTRVWHLVRFQPGVDQAPVNLGRVFIANPDFTRFKDDEGKMKPSHNGFITLADGKMINHRVSLGVCEASDGSVYILGLRPYVAVQVKVD